MIYLLSQPVCHSAKPFHAMFQTFDCALCVSPHHLLSFVGLPFGTPGVANILRVVHAAGPDFWDPALTSDRSQDIEVLVLFCF